LQAENETVDGVLGGNFEGWYEPPDEAMDNLKTGFAWTVPETDADGRAVKYKKRIKASVKNTIDQKDWVDDDFYQSPEWTECVTVTGVQVQRVTDKPESKQLEHVKVVLDLQQTLGVPSSNQGAAKKVFWDFYMKTASMSDDELKARGENGKPLKGKLDQTRMNKGRLESLLVAAGFSDVLNNGKIPHGGWLTALKRVYSLVDRDVKVRLRQELNLNDEANDNVLVFKAARDD
jgi:hypothetical protein